MNDNSVELIKKSQINCKKSFQMSNFLDDNIDLNSGCVLNFSNVFRLGGVSIPGENKLIGICSNYPHECFVQPCVWKLFKRIEYGSKNESFCFIF